MDVVVRAATVDDARSAASVYVSSAEHHHRLDPAFYRVPAMEAVVAGYRERIPDAGDDSVLLVAELDDLVVGTSFVRLMPPPSEASMLRPPLAAEVDVAVLPEFRRQGVGRVLMARAEGWAIEQGAGLVLLNCHTANEEAIRFYTEHLSYRRVGLLLGKDIGG